MFSSGQKIEFPPNYGISRLNHSVIELFLNLQTQWGKCLSPRLCASRIAGFTQLHSKIKHDSDVDV